MSRPEKSGHEKVGKLDPLATIGIDLTLVYELLVSKVGIPVFGFARKCLLAHREGHFLNLVFMQWLSLTLKQKTK